MPNFQGAVTQLTNTAMGAAVALQFAKERYVNKQINAATNYAKSIKPSDKIRERQTIAQNEKIDQLGKYIPSAYKYRFKEALNDLRPVSLEEKLMEAEAEREAEERANSIQNRQSAINKSKATKILPRDMLLMMQDEYVKQMKSSD